MRPSSLFENLFNFKIATLLNSRSDSLCKPALLLKLLSWQTRSLVYNPLRHFKILWIYPQGFSFLRNEIQAAFERKSIGLWWRKANFPSSTPSSSLSRRCFTYFICKLIRRRQCTSSSSLFDCVQSFLKCKVLFEYLAHFFIYLEYPIIYAIALNICVQKLLLLFKMVICGATCSQQISSGSFLLLCIELYVP